MHTVSYCCYAIAIKMASKVGVFFIVVLLFVTLAAAEASSVALVMLHWTMPRALLQCIRMAINMTRNIGRFVHCCHHFFAVIVA